MTSIRRIAANRRNAKRSTGPKTSAGRSRSGRNAMRHGLESARFKEQENPEWVNRFVEALCNGEDDPSCRLFAHTIADCEILLSRVRATRAAALQHISDQLEEQGKEKQSHSSVLDEDIDQLAAIATELSDGSQKQEDQVERDAFISLIRTYRGITAKLDTELQDGDIRTIVNGLNSSSPLFGAAMKLHSARQNDICEGERRKLSGKVRRLTERLNNSVDRYDVGVSSLDQAWAQVKGMERYERRALSKRRRAMRRLRDLRS